MQTYTEPSLNCRQIDVPDIFCDGNTRVFALEDELLFFSRDNGTLVRANPVAALIWNGLSNGLDWTEVVQLIAEAFGQSIDQVARDVEALLTQWQSSRVNGFERHPHDSRAPRNEDALPLLADLDSSAPSEKRCIELRCRLLHHTLRICLPGEAEKAVIGPLLAQLETTDRSLPSVTFEVRSGIGHYLLLCDGTPVDWCADELGLAPMVHAALHHFAYERGGHLIGIHAAAVLYGNRCLVLPAQCGSGKSTLTAALIARGFTFGSDDMVFLTPSPVKMLAAPLCLGIKSGSWEVLAKIYPQLTRLPIYERTDGRLVRYLAPPRPSSPRVAFEPTAVTHLLFPRYIDGAKTSLTPITRAEGLSRIAQAGYDVPGQNLSEACVEQLVGWMAGIECCEIRYGDLEDAVDQIKAVIA